MPDAVVTFKYANEEDTERWYDVSELVEGKSVVVHVSADIPGTAWETYETVARVSYDKVGNPQSREFFTNDQGDEISRAQWVRNGEPRSHRHVGPVLENWDEKTEFQATEAVREFLAPGDVNPRTGLHMPANQSDDDRIDVGTRVPNWVRPRIQQEEPAAAASSSSRRRSSGGDDA